MLITRIETLFGKGPYQNDKTMIDLYSELPFGVQPNPFDDGANWFPSPNQYFGFASHDQLLKWFNPSYFACEEQLKHMASKDMYVVEYDVEDKYVVCLNSQVMFDRSKAFPVSRMPLAELVI